jgi:hypothetical protein
MKDWDYVPWIILVLALICCCGSVEGFARFEDKSQRQRTDVLVNSSYSQKTNHSIPEKEFDAPISGVATPFRVNMYNAYL